MNFMKKILIVSKKAERCGIAQYGKRVSNILMNSPTNTYLHCLVDDEKGFLAAYKAEEPDVVIFNYYPVILPWATDVFLANNSLRTKTKFIAIFHELWLEFTPDAIITNDSVAVEDPNKNFYASPRPIFENVKFLDYKKEDVPVIGTFGFGFKDKNNNKLTKLVCETFDEAILKIHIPFAEFGDSNGILALETIKECKDIVANINPNITLVNTHNFLDDEELLNFLHQNDLNIFLYTWYGNRGLSSAIDYALSAKKPIAISNSEQFRHITNYVSSADKNLKEIIKEGIGSYGPLYEIHSNKKLIEKYDFVVNKITG